MRPIIQAFLKDDRGLETVEWVIVGSAVILGMLVILANLGGWVDDQYGDLQANTQIAPMVTVESNFNVPTLGYGETVPWMGTAGQKD
jgi:Flp pilus assembly pilin Flp